MNNILSVKNLSVHFSTEYGTVKAVDNISFGIPLHSSTALVGETGSGKSVTALSILNLIDPPGKITNGAIIFNNNQNLLSLSENQLQSIRGKEISMIFQDPSTSLNPVLPVGFQVAESLIAHFGYSKEKALSEAEKILKLVGLPPSTLSQFPHELSGGMKQRAMIASALICKPKLLIADEPTTALDVSIQAEILQLLQQMKKKFRLSLLLITHDLGIVYENCDNVIVLNKGQIVEQAKTKSIFSNPKMPYTKKLLASAKALSLR